MAQRAAAAIPDHAELPVQTSESDGSTQAFSRIQQGDAEREAVSDILQNETQAVYSAGAAGIGRRFPFKAPGAAGDLARSLGPASAKVLISLPNHHISQESSRCIR